MRFASAFLMHFLSMFRPCDAIFDAIFFQIASAFLMCKVVLEHQINGDFSYFLFARNESVSNTAFSMGEFAKVGFILILSRRQQLEASRRHGPTPLFDANALSFASQSSNFSM